MVFLLDFDGTLVDTERFKKDALSAFFEQFDIFSFEREEGDSSSAVIRKKLYNIFSEEKVENIVEEFKVFQNNFLKKKIKQEEVCFSDTIPFLEGLKERNIPSLIVTTSSRQLLETVAQHSKIDRYIDIKNSITKDDVPRGKEKPEPDPYLLAMKNNKIEVKDAYIVEDSIPGVQSATRSKGTVFYINRDSKNLPPLLKDGSREISKLSEIFTLLE